MELYEKLNNEFGFEYKDNKSIDTVQIIIEHKLSEDIIEELIKNNNFHSYLDNLLNIIVSHQNLSENFIEKYIKNLNGVLVSTYQKLSEDFIENHLDYIWWDEIFKYQKLSNNFISKYYEKSSFVIVANYNKINENLIRNNEELLNMYDIISEYNWLYKSTEEKKKAVIDTGKYECYDDYFIAYKAVRKDRHSLYNLQYKYKKGEIYESSCDCTPDENSFGLNVGTEDFSNRYGFLYSNYILIRCKVRYEDVGRVVHSGDKIRCFKIEIMD